MVDTKNWAMRIVGGWEVYLRRAPWEERWQISLCDRILNLPTALMDGELRTARLSGHHFEGQTFATPDEAAEAVRRLVAA
jgi:hypothetical protein